MLRLITPFLGKVLICLSLTGTAATASAEEITESYTCAQAHGGPVIVHSQASDESDRVRTFDQEWADYQTFIVHESAMFEANSEWLPIALGDPEIISGYAKNQNIKPTTYQACTAEKLYALGISLAGVSDLSPNYQLLDWGVHTNECGDGITLSDEYVAYFQKQGFTLDTLCLALTTRRVHIHPETGKVLPIAKAYSFVSDSLMLHPPACFRNGAPLRDCRIFFHWFWGYVGEGNYVGDKIKPTLQQFQDEAANWKAISELLESTISRMIAENNEEQIRWIDFESVSDFAGEDIAETIFKPYVPAGTTSGIIVDERFPLGFAYKLTAGTNGGDIEEVDLSALSEDVSENMTSTNVEAGVPWLSQDQTAESPERKADK